MSYTKRFLKSKAICKVRFVVSAEEAHGAGDMIYLTGEFNSWNTTTHPMKKRKDGSFALEIDLPTGQDFQFKYLTDAGVWFNDSDADAYIACSFAGGENSLIKV